MATLKRDYAETITERFYLSVMNNQNKDIPQLKSTVLGILDEAQKALEENRMELWSMYIGLAESIWERR